MRHNASITAPPILIPATEKTNDGWVLQTSQYLQPIKEFTHAYVTVGTDEYAEMETNTTKQDRDTIGKFATMQRQFATNPKAPTRRLIDNAESQRLFAGGFESTHQLAAVTWFNPTLVPKALEFVRLAVWMTKDQQFMPALFCKTIKTALFTLAAFKGVAECKNPYCGKLFVPDVKRLGRSGDYCSAKCGSRYRQQQLRFRKNLQRKALKA